MTVLRIEHKVPSFEGWKKAFDADPINRKKSGVIQYRVYRAADEPDYVIVDLEFENAIHANETLVALRKLWNKVEGVVIVGPKARILEIVEAVQL